MILRLVTNRFGAVAVGFLFLFVGGITASTPPHAQASDDAWLGPVFLIGGAALVVGGIVRIMIVARRERVADASEPETPADEQWLNASAPIAGPERPHR